MMIEDGGVQDFGKCLNEAQCPQCETDLEWEATFNANGTNYHAMCCDLIFTMRPHTVTTHIDKE